MSVQAVSWVLERSEAHLGARLVLLSIANHADRQGCNAWPSVSTIALEAHMSARQVQRCMRELVQIGELTIDANAGFNGTHRYTLSKMQGDNLSGVTICQGDNLSGVTNQAQKDLLGVTNRAESRPEMSPEPRARATKSKSNPKEGRAQARACPPDVPESTWADWLDLRKAKRAPVSETVISRARAESTKASMTFAEFLAEWCERGSQGLKAEWITNSRGGNRARGSPANPPIAQNFAAKTYTGTPENELPTWAR